jgi:hypothetical protein
MPHELVAKLLSELAAARATIAASYDKLWPANAGAKDAVREDAVRRTEADSRAGAEEPEAR